MREKSTSVTRLAPMNAKNKMSPALFPLQAVEARYGHPVDDVAIVRNNSIIHGEMRRIVTVSYIVEELLEIVDVVNPGGLDDNAVHGIA